MSALLAEILLPSLTHAGVPVQDAIQKADVLIEALHYIRKFRDKVTVIKLGGSVLEHPDALNSLLQDVVFMETVGMKPVLIHGGGKSITRAMEEAGLTARFVQGRRYTDDATLEVVDRVLGFELNTEIADRIESLEGRSAPLNFRTTNVLYGKPIKLADADGAQLDLGWVGDVTKVDKRTIQNLCYAGLIPVIPSLCQMEGSSQKLNVNADTAAAAVAQALGAEKLVYLSDIPGVLQDRHDPQSLINSLTAREARELISSGAIDGGMIPKVQACLDVIDGGVKKVHIIDGRLRHSLLLEIYTRSGVGTEISQDG